MTDAGDRLLDALQQFKDTIQPPLEEIASVRYDESSYEHPEIDVTGYDDPIRLPYSRADGLTGFCIGVHGHHFGSAGLSLDVPTPLYPAHLNAFPSAVDEMWQKEFGCEYSKTDQISTALETVEAELVNVKALATFDDFLTAVENQNNELVELICDVRQFRIDRGREVDGLLNNVERTVRWRDHSHAFITVERISLFDGEFDEGYLIGEDDGGFFIHPVDTTNLNENQDVNYTDIRTAIGFDSSLSSGTPQFNLGEKIRVQGDLCIERVEQSSYTENKPNQCNIPIDNHLVIINAAEVTSSIDSEPVDITAPEKTTTYIVHDEHDLISFTLPSGNYQFSLLDRGVRPEEERPLW